MWGYVWGYKMGDSSEYDGIRGRLLRRFGWVWNRRRDFYRLRSRARLYGQYVLHRRTPTTSLLTIGTARVGSTLLNSYLNSLPNVSMRGEVLNPHSPQGLPYDSGHRGVALRHLRVNLRSQASSVGGLKILLGSFKRHGLTIGDLQSVAPDLRFLIIYRRSLADQFVSREIARRTGSFVLTERGTPRRVSVHVDREEFRRYCKRTRKLYRQLLSDRFVTDRALVLSYEELTEDAEVIFRRSVCPFLEIDYHPVQTGFIKQNPSPLSEKVSNFADVQDVLTGPDAQQDYAI